jgi:hypothetical protein
MANDPYVIEIPIVVRDNQLKSAVNTTNRLERELTRLAKAVDSNSVSEERYRQTLIKVGRELKSVTQLTGNQAYGAVVRYTNAKQKQIAATARAQEAIRREADEQKKAAAEQKRVEQATRENTIALNRMRAAYDSSFAVEQRTLELKRRLRQEIANGKMTLRQAGAELLKYRGHMQQFNMAQMAATKTSNRFGVVTQQAGYQIGDFLVQVQSGTNFMVAFGQQATQLVGILPLLAPSGGTFLGLTAKGLIGLSAGLGIAIPLVTALGAAFLRTRPEAEKATTSFEGVKDALDKIEAVNFDKLGDEFLETAKEIRQEFSSILGIIEDVARNKLEDSLAAPLKAVIAELESFESRASLAAQIQAGSPDFGGQFGLKSRNEAVFLATQLARLDGETREELQGQLEAISEALFLRGILTDEVKATLVELAGELSLMESITSEAENTVAATQDIADRQETLKEGAQGFLNIWNAITGKIGESVDKIIAANLELKVLNSANRSSVTTYGGRGSGAEYNRPAPSGAFVPTQETLDAYNKMMGLSGKTASQAAAQVDELQQEIDRLNETAAEGRTPFDKYNKAIAHLNMLRSRGLSFAAYSMEIERLNDELAKSLPMVNDVADAFGDFLARGLTDFKSFANSIFKSFQNMLAQMIATAVRNKILISMGATGSAAGTAASAGVGGAIGASIGGIGAGIVGVGSNLAAAGTTALGMGGMFTGSFGAGMGATMTGGLAGGASAFGTGVGMMGTAGSAMSGFAMAAGAALPVIAAVAVAVALFRKKTKELDSGLNVTVKNMDALVTSFKTVQTSRFFGLSKKTSTSTGGVSSEVSDPIVAAVQQIQQSVLTAAEAFGFGADAFDNFSYEFKLSLKGLSEEQQMQKINEELAKMGDSFASLTGHFSSMNELLEAAEHRYQIENRMLEALGRSTEVVIRNRERELAATHALNRGLLQATFNLEDAQAAVDNAFTGLRAAIDKVVTELRAKLSVANEAVNRSRSIFNQLESALSGRSLTSGIGQAFARREGALGFLKGGDFSDEKKLDEALRVVSEPTEDLFGSFVDYAREFARTSRTLEDAKNVAETQLTADEKQVMLLEQQIASAEAQYQIQVDQYNALMGIDTSVQSVGEAIATLKGAIEALAKAQEAAKAAAAASAGGGGSGGGGSPLKKLGTYSPETALGKNPLPESAIGKQYLQIRGEQNLLSAAQSAGVKTKGKSGAEIQQALSNSLNAVINMDNATRGQRFARGGMFNGGMRLVGEEGPELEVTGPSRIYSKQQTKDLLRGGDSNEGEGLRAEVSEMRQELRQLLIANNKYTKRSYDLYNKWDIDGLPAERT